MTTDIAIPLDGKIALDAEPHAYRVPRVRKLNDSVRNPNTRAAVKDAQAIRHRALLAEGCVVKVGALGTTVFRGAGSNNFTPFKVWDGHR
jgi:hypothetical protein